MEYEIRSMSNSSRITGTLPRRGQVNEVCKEWLVHEDEALAYRLQKEEVDEHYTGNRFRNAQVREDFPKAKVEQQKELEEAASKYRQMRHQEEIDSSYAKHVAEELKQIDFKKKQLEFNDHGIARRVQKHETEKRHSYSPDTKMKPDVNQVGLPLIVEAVEYQSNSFRQPNLAITHNIRKLKLSEPLSTNQNSNLPSLDTVDKGIPDVSLEATVGPSYLVDEADLFTEKDLKRETERRMQEERDAEFAKLLQEQEGEISQESLVDRDRLLAIEAQDKELAKLLQDKEKAKLRRAREKAKQKAKQKALLKKQQSQGSEAFTTENNDGDNNNNVAESEVVNSAEPNSRPNADRLITENVNYGDEEPPSINNVAIAIDPTFSYTRPDNTSSFTYLDNTAPPYMPIQGQRRTTSLEKKQKKSKYREGCKQQ